MFTTLRNAWKIPELRKKILFTLFVLMIYRLGACVPVPYVNVSELATYLSQQLSGTVLADLALYGLPRKDRRQRQRHDRFDRQQIFNALQNLFHTSRSSFHVTISHPAISCAMRSMNELPRSAL